MTLKKSTIEINGKTVRVKELSMAAHLRIEELGDGRKPNDVIKECVEEEDWKELTKNGNEIPFKEYQKLIKAVDEVNGLGKLDS